MTQPCTHICDACGVKTVHDKSIDTCLTVLRAHARIVHPWPWWAFPLVLGVATAVFCTGCVVVAVWL